MVSTTCNSSMLKNVADIFLSVSLYKFNRNRANTWVGCDYRKITGSWTRPKLSKNINIFIFSRPTTWYMKRFVVNRFLVLVESKWAMASVLGFALNSLRPSDAIRRHRSGSTLAQVMACCLTAPNHYLNQWWLIISKAQWHSADGSFTRDTSAISLWN